MIHLLRKKAASSDFVTSLLRQPIEVEAPPGFEPGVKVLQTSALPLGYGAVR